MESFIGVQVGAQRVTQVMCKCPNARGYPEPKELIAMHSSVGPHGGDLNTDTITIIGATLVVRQSSALLVNCLSVFRPLTAAMTPINDVFMLPIDNKLDYETLREICATGHGGVPMHEEVEVPTSGVIEARNKAGSAIAALLSPDGKEGDKNTMTVKRIIGIFLVKKVGDLLAPPIRCTY